MQAFQIVFTPTAAAELVRMPKELQLQILGEFRGLPQQVLGTELDEFGKLEQGGRILHRFRVGDYRVYFERHELGVLVHRILSRHTLKDFLFRSGLKTGEARRFRKTRSSGTDCIRQGPPTGNRPGAITAQAGRRRPGCCHREC
jgi:mRNA-degrading endonuclease RelE of RelBE toxin-antitoxin system